MSHTFQASFYSDRTDRDGESRITLAVPMTDVDTISAIKKEYAGQQVLMKVTIETDPSN